jgi:hypothetical protein
MSHPATVVPSRLIRRLVLGTAFFLGLAVALVPQSPLAHAQEPKTPAATAPKPGSKSMWISDGHGAEIKIDVSESPRPAGKSESAASPDATTSSEGASEDAGTGGGKARKRARVMIEGIGTDREFDSFDELVHDEPALAAMVVGIVTVVFFAPVLAIALILWYRMRKARMLNETMLKLAERGIVPSADALDALSGGKQPAAAATYYEQAKQVQRRAAWSDLRKGVLISGVGFALSMHSLMASRTPNVVGLVLLFVGLGFVVLWWFEQRHLVPPAAISRDAAGGPGPTPGNPPPT